jgi:transcription elongation factor SPT5
MTKSTTDTQPPTTPISTGVNARQTTVTSTRSLRTSPNTARTAAIHYTGDINDIPQRLPMPSVHDASLWQVCVKVCSPHVLLVLITPFNPHQQPGKERDIVNSLMCKALDLEDSTRLLQILSTFQPDYVSLLQHIMRTNSEKGAEFAAQLVNDETGQ